VVPVVGEPVVAIGVGDQLTSAGYGTRPAWMVPLSVAAMKDRYGEPERGE
jgi:hypothetical protein